MAKKIPILATAICFTMALTSNANAAGWLDIIKSIVSGAIGTPQASVQQAAQPPANPAPATNAPATPKTAQPTEAEILAALDSLNAMCARIASQGLPCGVGVGRGGSLSAAQKIASNRATQELGKAIQTSMEINSNDIMETIMQGDEVITKETFNEAVKSTTSTQVNGSQTYLSYSYKKGNTYEMMIVKVLNPALFEQAMSSTLNGGSIGKQILQESIKTATDGIKTWCKKNKR